MDWLPYLLDVPLYLGSATVGTDATVLDSNRNPHRWRRRGGAGAVEADHGGTLGPWQRTPGARFTSGSGLDAASAGIGHPGLVRRGLEW
jgi:hypothetical protein